MFLSNDVKVKQSNFLLLHMIRFCRPVTFGFKMSYSQLSSYVMNLELVQGAVLQRNSQKLTTSKIERFATLIKYLQPLTVGTKRSILYVHGNPGYTPAFDPKCDNVTSIIADISQKQVLVCKICASLVTSSIIVSFQRVSLFQALTSYPVWNLKYQGRHVQVFYIAEKLFNRRVMSSFLLQQQYQIFSVCFLNNLSLEQLRLSKLIK